MGLRFRVKVKASLFLINKNLYYIMQSMCVTDIFNYICLNKPSNGPFLGNKPQKDIWHYENLLKTDVSSLAMINK